MKKKQKSAKPKVLIRDPSWEPNAMAPLIRQLVAIAKSGDTAFGTDRAIAITLAAHLERTLEIGISVLLKNNDDKTLEMLYSERGPLGTFSSKIGMAYALGAIDAPIKNELDSIRKIRNAFAHATSEISFGSSAIATECKKLNPLRLLGVDPKSTKQSINPQHIFIGVAAFLFVKLLVDALMPASRTMLEKAKSSGDAKEIESAEKFHKTAEVYSQYFPLVQSIINILSKAPPSTVTASQ